MPDETLMLHVQRGDRGAYDQLYTRWRMPLFRFLLRRTCSRQNAEEALQDTWMRVYKYRRTYDTARSFRAWVYTIAINAGRDAHRPEYGRTFLRPELLRHGGDGRTLVQARDSVMRALHRLGPEDRRLLLLAGVGFNSREIAQMMSVPDSTVRTRIQRARESIRENYDEA